MAIASLQDHAIKGACDVLEGSSSLVVIEIVVMDV